MTDLERPNERWQGQTWRGPAGTTCDDWRREVVAIKAAIEAREEARATRKGYKTPHSIRWRLDCLSDLLVVLEHNTAQGLQYQKAPECSTMTGESNDEVTP